MSAVACLEGFRGYFWLELAGSPASLFWLMEMQRLPLGRDGVSFTLIEGQEIPWSLC